MEFIREVVKVIFQKLWERKKTFKLRRKIQKFFKIGCSTVVWTKVPVTWSTLSGQPRFKKPWEPWKNSRLRLVTDTPWSWQNKTTKGYSLTTKTHLKQQWDFENIKDTSKHQRHNKLNKRTWEDKKKPQNDTIRSVHDSIQNICSHQKYRNLSSPRYQMHKACWKFAETEIIAKIPVRETQKKKKRVFN